jgi:hypothetical protein
MSIDPKNRFAAVTAELRKTSALSGAEEATGLGRFRREKAAEQTNVSNGPKAEETAIFKVLNDASLDPKEKAQKIAEFLFFNEEDLEANAKALAENQAMVAQLLKDFTEHNRESIKLTRDNPLSELRTSIKDVFDEYREMVAGRSDLQEKLKVIDDILSKHGGTEGLVKALMSAKGKEEEKEALESAVRAEQARVEGLRKEARDTAREVSALRAEIEGNESDTFLFFKRGKKHEIAQARQRLTEKETALAGKQDAIATAGQSLGEKAKGLEAFMSNGDYHVHTKILGILDIGTEEFREKLTNLSNVTLNYIDNTSTTLESVRNQLEKLLGRVTDAHTTTQNTVENVSILLDAQGIAQKHNTALLQKIQETPADGGLEGMKREKKLRGLNAHVTGIEKHVQSTATISGELGKVQIGLTNFKDQMQEGLSEAMGQQMMAVSSAAATGNATLMRIETLATFIQGLVVKDQYMQEAQYHLGEIAKEMERSIMSRMATNEGIRSMGDVVSEMVTMMSDRNDVVLQTAEERKKLIESLIEQNDRLGKTNEQALAIEGLVNKKLYGEGQDGRLDERLPSSPGPS